MSPPPSSSQQSKSSTRPKLTLSVNTTPIFQTWYLVSIELNLGKGERRTTIQPFAICVLRFLPSSAGCLSPRHKRRLLGDGFLGGVEIQGALVQPQQLRYPLGAVQVPVLFDHLHDGGKIRDGWRTTPPLRLTFHKDHQTARDGR